jgi:hypothetical protein
MPVLIGSWSEAEERKILATLDPIAGMAEQADEIYRELLKGMETENVDLRQWCDGVMKDLGGMDETDEMQQNPIVPDKDPNVMVRLSFHPGLWLGKRQEILGIMDKLTKTYNATVKIEE